MTDELRAAVPEGQGLHYETGTRGGGAVGLTDRRLLYARPGREVVGVDLSDVEEVTVQSFDWFLGVLSLALLGFGVASLGRNLLAGTGFAVAGLVSLGVTYRKRGTVRVNVEGRKPLAFRVDDTDGFQSAYRRQAETYQARLDARHSGDTETGDGTRNEREA